MAASSNGATPQNVLAGPWPAARSGVESRLRLYLRARELGWIERRMGADLEPGDRITHGLAGYTGPLAHFGVCVRSLARSLGWIEPRLLLIGERNLYLYKHLRRGQLLARYPSSSPALRSEPRLTYVVGGERFRVRRLLPHVAPPSRECLPIRLRWLRRRLRRRAARLAVKATLLALCLFGLERLFPVAPIIACFNLASMTAVLAACWLVADTIFLLAPRPGPR